ncbi:MAG: PD40 domain-containing protein [Thermoleophilia bacterium]|nr:PD40 domain-containing protein [Thermoleophilia bacterium]
MRMRGLSSGLVLLGSVCALAGGTAASSQPGGKLLICSNRADPTDVTRRSYDLYVASGNGAVVARLTDASGEDCDAEWSPDGKRIVFVSYRNDPDASGFGNAELYVMNADGSKQIRLTANEVADKSPTWSPDGRRIAFTRQAGSQSGEAEDLYVMNADGSGETKLVTGNPRNSGPSWSPDGTRIALHSWDEAGPAYGGIFLIDPDGSNLVGLTHPPASAGDFGPAWSPDGTKVAFWRGLDLYSVNADGSGETLLVATGQNSSWGRITWSPDGKRIAFGKEAAGGVDVNVVDSDGSGETLLLGEAATEMPLDWRTAAWPGDCTIAGTHGPDTLSGTAGADVICGLGGNDVLLGAAGNDVLRGGKGDDRLFGEAGRDRLEGGPGRDYAHGGAATDVCVAETRRFC